MLNDHVMQKLEEIVGQINNLVKLPEQGCTSKVQKITTKNGSYLLKSSSEEKFREWVKTEAEVLKKLNSQREIPVPTYFGFIEEKFNSHLLMSFEDGITLTAALEQAKNSSEKKMLLRSFGQFLNQLHNIPKTDFLNHSDDWLENRFVKAASYVEHGQTEGSLQLLETLKANKPSSVVQTVIHGDCVTDNVLVSNGEVRIFIDVAGMAIGDPRYDESLAIRGFVNNEELLKSFYEGYKRYKVTKEEFLFFEEGLYEFF